MAEARMFYQEDCNLSLLDGKTIAVIGYGRASKIQVVKSVASLVSGAGQLPEDEADASGAAITHIFTHKI